MQIRVLVHKNSKPFTGNEVLVEGDIARPETLAGFLETGGILVNLAYPGAASRSESLAAAKSLAEAGAEVGIKRMIHCSTAAVAGRAPDAVVDEKTLCQPATEYEQAKLAIEGTLQEQCAGKFELAILRPTAVFGPGGRNLLKLARSLAAGNRAVNYLKSCFHGRRRMNLICIDNMVAALLFLLDADIPLKGDVFVVSDDEFPANNYRDVEMRLMERLGVRDYAVPPIPVPDPIRSLVLRLSGGSNSNPRRIYDGRKLASLGFRKPATLDAGIISFADWYRRHCLVNPASGAR